ncbi:hypothetical protein [Roseomonas sp. BN140053]|uniref:hypothetical protein n=1 Tax=Roseomonas sp. BN140053 TaxID=3391898 RepID=UPI0039EA7D00
MAQFALSLVLLRVLDIGAFGSFSFLLIVSQLSWGVWGALFCAPLPILLTAGDVASRRRLLRSLFTTNLLGAGLAFMLFLPLGIVAGVAPGGAALFAASAALALLRWFARAHAYATGRPLRATASDLAYSLVLLAGLVLILLARTADLEMAFTTLLLGAVAGLLPFGRDYLVSQFTGMSWRDLPGYRAVWRQFAGWSLLGVVTTEATANSHVYIVTLVYGPEGFAPIAASTLLVRPMNVAMNALTEFERARMARQIGDGQIGQAAASVRFFRWVLVTGWIANVLAAGALLYYGPRLVFPPQYSMPFLVTAAALWMAVVAVRLLRTPESALLQSAGAFRPLALASVASSGISVVAVAILLAVSGPLWSIGGILIGELAFAGWIWRQTRLWVASAMLRSASSPDSVIPARAAGCGTASP